MADGGPQIIPFPNPPATDDDPVVITGIGVCSSLGATREEVWQNIQRGISGVRQTNDSDGLGLELPCGMIDWLERRPDELRTIQLSRLVAAEALEDACIHWSDVDRNRFACSMSAQFGDIGYTYEPPETRDQKPEREWWNQFLPCTATSLIANEFGLFGPRLCHTTACASGLVSTMGAARMLMDDQADFALCGAADAIHPFVFAAFNRMGVLAPGPDPQSACKPFDQRRSGFVMGEGASVMVLEKRSRAVARGAKIYAEIAAQQSLCQALHVTHVDGEVEPLKYLIQRLTTKAGWSYRGPQYINAHGTGTLQNDRNELTAFRAAFDGLADDLLVSSNKAVIGHLINAAGSVELALTALALRDGYAPPTMHLDVPDPVGNIDCLANAGSQRELDRALKLSLAFGGHLVGMALRRSTQEDSQRSPVALHPEALIREKPQRQLRAA